MWYHDKKPFEKLDQVIFKSAANEAQLSNDIQQQYVAADLETVDETATEDSAFAFAYEEHVKCF